VITSFLFWQQQYKAKYVRILGRSLKSKTYEASDEARASFLAGRGFSFFFTKSRKATEIENMRFDTLPSPKQHRWLYSMV